MSITYKEPNNTALTGGVTPDNKLWFYSSAYFDRNQGNTLWFSTKSDQWTWFERNAISKFITDDVTYAIKDEYSIDFRVPYSTEDMYQCAYVCRIKGYGTLNEKRWYYFIDSVEAYSPNSSIIHCYLDVLQTFMFSWKLGNQPILNTHGLTSTNMGDERWFSCEDFMPPIEECSDTVYINPSIADTRLPGLTTGWSGKVFDQCYLLVATECYDIVGGWTSNPYTFNNPNDPGDLIYIVFNDTQKLRTYINKYHSDTKSNAIKGVYGIPLICALGESTLEASPVRIVSDTTLGYVVYPGKWSTTYSLSFPSSFYGYTPKNIKTRMSNILSLETRTGTSALFKNVDLSLTPGGGGEYFVTLTIVGDLSISPKVLVFPHAMPETNSSIKSSNYLSCDISPSYSIYDDSAVQIYNENYDLAIMKNTLTKISAALAVGGAIASTVATGGLTVPALLAGAGGMVAATSADMSKAQLQATYQIPQNLIGTCESSDAWINGINYIVARWLTPCVQNLKAYDNLLSIMGYNCAGKIMDISGTGGYGVTMFSRTYFCFIKTANCKLVGGNVGIYKEAIETLFNNGIRFWNISNNTLLANGICNYTSTILSGN